MSDQSCLHDCKSSWLAAALNTVAHSLVLNDPGHGRVSNWIRAAAMYTWCKAAYGTPVTRAPDMSLCVGDGVFVMSRTREIGRLHAATGHKPEYTLTTRSCELNAKHRYRCCCSSRTTAATLVCT